MGIADKREAGDLDSKRGRIPPGPPEEYRAKEDFLEWMGRQFRIFGDIYKASIAGSTVFLSGRIVAHVR